MAKPFRSDKRKKELQRLKKQEEKRLRRFGHKPPEDATEDATEEISTENEESTTENSETTETDDDGTEPKTDPE